MCLLFFQEHCRKRMSITSGEITHTHMHQQPMGTCPGPRAQASHWSAAGAATDVLKKSANYLIISPPAPFINSAISSSKGLSHLLRLWDTFVFETSPYRIIFLLDPRHSTFNNDTSVGQMERVALKHIRYLMKNRELVGSYSIT